MDGFGYLGDKLNASIHRVGEFKELSGVLCGKKGSMNLEGKT